MGRVFQFWRLPRLLTAWACTSQAGSAARAVKVLDRAGDEQPAEGPGRPDAELLVGVPGEDDDVRVKPAEEETSGHLDE